jgi:hypothetical protein
VLSLTYRTDSEVKSGPIFFAMRFHLPAWSPTSITAHRSCNLALSVQTTIFIMRPTVVFSVGYLNLWTLECLDVWTVECLMLEVDVGVVMVERRETGLFEWEG